MGFALLVSSMLLNQASIFDEPPPRGEHQQKRPVHWGGALDVALGGAVYQKPEVAPERFDLSVRADVHFVTGPVSVGGFTQLAATIGQDLRLGFGPILLIPFAEDLFAVAVTPAFYERHTAAWEPGFSVGLALLWSYGLGVGVDGRLGVGPTRERALVVSAHLNVLQLATSLFMLSWGKGPT